MITVINKIGKFLWDTKLILLVGLFVGFISFYTADFKGIEEPDTRDYFDVAKNGINSEAILRRPILYPAVIKLSMIFVGENSKSLLVVLQILFYVSSVIALLLFISKYATSNKIPNLALASIALIAFLNPQTLAYNSVILPENIPIVCIISVAFFSAAVFKKVIPSLTFGLLLIIPILFKPVWIFILVLPFAGKLFSGNFKSQYLYSVIIPVSFAILIYISIQSIIKRNAKSDTLVATTMDVNLNLALIRGGLIEGTENTKLYRFLTEKELISKVKARTWDNSIQEFTEFTFIKDELPYEIREDKSFWKASLSKPKNFFAFFMIQSKRVVKFFTTSASNSSIQFHQKQVDYFYQSFYYYLHKIIVFPVFLLLSLYVLWQKTNPFISMLWLFTLLSSFVLAFFTYQDSHFLRMRSAVEPILAFLILYILFEFFKELQFRFKNGTMKRVTIN